MSIQITINQEVNRLKHSIGYGELRIKTDLKLSGCVIDDFYEFQVFYSIHPGCIMLPLSASFSIRR